MLKADSLLLKEDWASEVTTSYGSLKTNLLKKH